MATKKVKSVEEVLEENTPVQEEVNNPPQEVEEETDGSDQKENVVKIEYVGSNPSFTIDKVIFKPGDVMVLGTDLAAIALKNKGFKRVN